MPWLERLCGKGVVEKMWKPLLDSKFDGVYDDLPATYIWSRTRRMGGTRDRSGQEVLGWMEGGYQKLIDSLVGVMIVPLQDEFGWSRATISVAVSINLILYGLGGPFAAALYDRFGIRRVIVIALATVALSSP